MRQRGGAQFKKRRHMVKRTRRPRLPARRGAQPGLGAQRALMAAIADSERARHMLTWRCLRASESADQGRETEQVSMVASTCTESVASIWHPPGRTSV
eukprot:7198841-Prymnesium_polylepis.1